jgi:hypothetical protein
MNLVRPGDVDLSRVDVEFAHIKGGRLQYDAAGRSTVIERRQQLDRPPFVASAQLWARAVDTFHQLRGRGQARGVPFIVVVNIYRQLGGDFR